jgi:ELWxxDGT repeat protein
MKISSIGPMRGTLAHHDALVAADREEWTRRIAFAAVLLFVAPAALRAQTPYLVKDLNMNAATSARSSRPEHFFRYGSRVVFKSSTEDGYAIWITDGTEAGTVRLLDGPRGDSWTPRFAMLNDKLLFNAYERDHGEELWISDGTSAGTRLLADIGRYTSQPGDRIVYRSSMIFSADDRVNGRELWITDGTAAGTRLFADLVAGPEGSEPRAFVLFNDLIYFVAAGGLEE